MSETVGADGEMVTLVMLGAVLSTVTLADTGVPESVPSEGVTVQVTVSPDEKADDRVVAVPTTVPPIDHSMVDASASPSASEKPA